MRFHLLVTPLLGLLLPLPSPAQQSPQLTSRGYTISGQDPRLADRRAYLLAAERPTPTQPWPALNSVQADATGHLELHGYSLRMCTGCVLTSSACCNPCHWLTNSNNSAGR